MVGGGKRVVPMTAVELPKDIAVEILLKLPLETLVRFKCVCKSWRLFIDDPTFGRNHINIRLNKGHNLTKMLILNNKQIGPTFQSLTYDEKSGGFLKPSELDFPKDLNQCYRVVGCCDGLICIVSSNNSIILWNPSIRKYKKLPVPSNFRYYGIYGLGYDSSIADYKVIRARYADPLYFNPDIEVELHVEVLTLETNSWRMIPRFPPYFFIDNNHQPIPTNGALHWPASTFKHAKPLILCFDLAKEKFGEVPLPCCATIEKHKFGLAIFGGCLSLLDHSRLRDVTIWVMKEYVVRESWIKVVTISMIQTLTYTLTWFDHESKPLCFTETGGVLLTLKERICLVYNPKDNTFKQLQVRGIEDWSDNTLYAESLVSPYAN